MTPSTKSMKSRPVVTLYGPLFVLYQEEMGITLKNLTHIYDKRPFGGYGSYEVDIVGQFNLYNYFFCEPGLR